MYSIRNITDNTSTISDTIIEVYLHTNGSYILADRNHAAQGFVGKIPTTYEVENPETSETKTTETVVDTVFAYEGATMKGYEPVGSWEETPAVPVIKELEGDLEEAYALLYGGAK